MDSALAAEAFKMPGIDPRQWISYGTVDAGTPEQPPIIFKDADGNPGPYGPLVMVTLQPTGISVPCRVAGAIAGNGEADWYPFVPGDEVLVAIPEGDERAGCAIIGRLNQELDTFPLIVAGQDVTKNTFGFRRMRTPFIVETAAAYLIRSALTGSQIGIDSEGKVIINDGDQGSLAIGPEAIGLSSGDGESFMTIFPASKETYLGAGSSTFLLSETESKFISQAAISFATLGGSPNGTAVTAEQVVAFVINVLAVLASAGSFTAGPLASAAYTIGAPAAMGTVIGGALTPLGGVVPFANPGAPAGNFASLVGLVFGPGSPFAAAAANPIAPVDPTGFTLGYSRPGFKL